MWVGLVNACYTCFMLSDRVLEYLHHEGRVFSRALPRVRSLIAHGLSLEQALVGTGLVVPEQYGEALAQVYGVPFVRVTSDSVVSDETQSLRWHALEALPLHRHNETVVGAFTQPDHDRLAHARDWLAAQGLRLEARVMLRSDWLRYGRVPSVTALPRHLFQLIEQANPQRVAVHPRHDHIEIVVDPEHASGPRWTLPDRSSGGFVLALARRLDGDTWETTISHTPYGLALDASRRTSHDDLHPSRASETIRSFLQQPHGLLVVVRPDTAMCHALTEKTRAAIRPIRSSVDEEAAVHDALAGDPIVATQTTDRPTWWNALSHAEIPVRVVASTLTTHGRSWSIIRV